MLAVTQLIGFGVNADPVPTLTYKTVSSSTTNASSYSYSSVAIGAADTTRRVVVAAVMALGSGGPLTAITSATIGGITATVRIFITSDDALGKGVAFFDALVPTGTTATIAYTVDATAARSSIGVWTITGNADLRLTDAVSSPTGVTLNPQLEPDGVLIAACHNGGNITWTNATERFDMNVEGSTFYSGADFSNANGAGGPYAVTRSSSTPDGFAAVTYR